MKHKIQECSATGKETGNSQNRCFTASHERSVSTTTKSKQNKIKDRCFLLESSQFTNQWCSAIEQKDSWPAFWSATEIHNGRNLASLKVLYQQLVTVLGKHTDEQEAMLCCCYPSRACYQTQKSPPHDGIPDNNCWFPFPGSPVSLVLITFLSPRLGP